MIKEAQVMKVFIALLMLVGCSGETKPPKAETIENGVLASLRTLTSAGLADNDRTIKVNIGLVDLDDDGTNEAAAYLSGDRTCGSGGCVAYVLKHENDSYQPITRLTVVWPPIRVLASKSNGWHDLGVWVQGGGVQPGHEARLRFDGRTYPENPSVIGEKSGRAGTVLIARSTAAMALYK
jgi:hypothetical protein